MLMEDTMANTAEVSLSKRISAPANRLLLGGILALVIAVSANVLIFGIARAMGLTLTIPYQGPDVPAAPLPVLAVIIVSALAAIGGTVLLWGLTRVTARATGIFQAIATVFFLLSLGGPLTMPTDTPTRAALIAMHVVAAVSIVTVLSRFSARNSHRVVSNRGAKMIATTETQLRSVWQLDPAHTVVESAAKHMVVAA
jgi:hypothetical protein